MIEISSDSDKKILRKKILIKKILMKKILMKKILTKKIVMKEIENNTNVTNNKCFIIFFFVYIKMVNKYYPRNKERLRKEARERY